MPTTLHSVCVNCRSDSTRQPLMRANTVYHQRMWGLKTTAGLFGVKFWNSNAVGRRTAFHGLIENEPASQPAPSPVVKRASIPDWPARLTWSNERTFKQWFVAEENFDATRLCEAVVDAPGQR